LSAHSFGIAIDLNTAFANYWQWDCKCTAEEAALTFKNNIPQEIIDVFEKHGFIWGGKWYHYDTMHFEYRPELLVEFWISKSEIPLYQTHITRLLFPPDSCLRRLFWQTP
jgi:hypothetical protein